jgi:hypothetical protein
MSNAAVVRSQIFEKKSENVRTNKSTQSTTLYIKEEEVNTATHIIEKNYYRVDKKTTS